MTLTPGAMLDVLEICSNHVDLMDFMDLCIPYLTQVLVVILG